MVASFIQEGYQSAGFDIFQCLIRALLGPNTLRNIIFELEVRIGTIIDHTRLTELTALAI
jgi:hypothetical protein